MNVMFLRLLIIISRCQLGFDPKFTRMNLLLEIYNGYVVSLMKYFPIDE